MQPRFDPKKPYGQEVRLGDDSREIRSYAERTLWQDAEQVVPSKFMKQVHIRSHEGRRYNMDGDRVREPAMAWVFTPSTVCLDCPLIVEDDEEYAECVTCDPEKKRGLRLDRRLARVYTPIHSNEGGDNGRDDVRCTDRQVHRTAGAP